MAWSLPTPLPVRSNVTAELGPRKPSGPGTGNRPAWCRTSAAARTHRPRGWPGRMTLLPRKRLPEPGHWMAVLPYALVREIIVRGSGGGPLTPLADQFNHELT